jgi:hypothetical protein
MASKKSMDMSSPPVAACLALSPGVKFAHCTPDGRETRWHGVEAMQLDWLDT